MILAQITGEQLEKLGEQFAPLPPQVEPANPVVTGSFSFLIGSLARVVFELGTYAFLIALLVSGAIYLFSFGSEEAVKRGHRALYWSFIGFAIFISSNAILQFYLGRLKNIPASLTVSTLIAEVFNTTFLVASVGFLAIFLTSGLRYFFTGGNEESASNARRAMIYAFVGLMVTAMAFAIGRVITTSVGIVKQF